MVRNFGLYRLDATYEIREDVQDAVQRLQPRAPTSAAAGGGETSFRGWARMAQPLAAFRIAKVGRPRTSLREPLSIVLVPCLAHGAWHCAATNGAVSPATTRLEPAVQSAP